MASFLPSLGIVWGGGRILARIERDISILNVKLENLTQIVRELE